MPQVQDRWQIVLGDRVPQPHCRMRVDAAEREELRQAFDEPQRQLTRGLAARIRMLTLENIELKSVDQLMAEHVLGFGK